MAISEKQLSDWEDWFNRGFRLDHTACRDAVAEIRRLRRELANLRQSCKKNHAEWDERDDTIVAEERHQCALQVREMIGNYGGVAEAIELESPRTASLWAELQQLRDREAKWRRLVTMDAFTHEDALEKNRLRAELMKDPTSDAK